MDNIQNWLQQLENELDTAEDRTIYSRETPQGPRVDFEIIERTKFGAFPETVRELQSKAPLPCGHQVSKENPFGGYCNGRKFEWPFRTKKCGREYCSLCAVQCPRCGIYVGASCCARNFEGVFFCKTCKRKKMALKVICILAAILLHPFIGQDKDEDARPETPSEPSSRS